MDREEQLPFGAAGWLGDRAGYLVGVGPGTRIRRLEDQRIERTEEQRPYGVAGRLGDRDGCLVGVGPGTRNRVNLSRL